jgi:hypothetical protein
VFIAESTNLTRCMQTITNDVYLKMDKDSDLFCYVSSLKSLTEHLRLVLAPRTNPNLTEMVFQRPKNRPVRLLPEVIDYTMSLLDLECRTLDIKIGHITNINNLSSLVLSFDLLRVQRILIALTSALL